MPLDSEMAEVLDQLNSMPALETLSLAEMRAFSAMLARNDDALIDTGLIENRSIVTPDGLLPLRIYRSATEPVAVMVYYHGGGWTLGDLETADDLLRGFALQTGCCVVSVDYRLAPEHPFPAAVLDASSALAWASDNCAELAGSRVPLLVAGDSAGGNLAAVAALLARDNGGPSVAGQLLFYPATDAAFDTQSYLEFGEGMLLTRNVMRWFWDQYLPDEASRSDFRASPLRAEDLSGLPPTLIQTAEYDPLRDEGEDFGARLKRAGNSVTIQRLSGLIHGYLSMTKEVGAARAAVADAAQWVRATVG